VTKAVKVLANLSHNYEEEFKVKGKSLREVDVTLREWYNAWTCRKELDTQ